MHRIYSLFILVTLLQIFACKNDDFTLAGDWIDPNFKVITIDTLSVDLYTFEEDSIITQNQNVILVGHYNDEGFTGKTTASSYMELRLPNSKKIEDYSYFDSIVIEMRFNRSYFGDTTTNQYLSIYKLAERIELKDDNKNFYNTTTFKVENSPIVTTSFANRPTTNVEYDPNEIYQTEPVRIRLPDALGQELFNKLVNEDDEIENNDRFIDYFKGLAFIPDKNKSKSIVGIKTDTTFRMRLYYHTLDITKIERHLDFSINVSNQFNHIEADRSNTQMPQIDEYDGISSTKTGNKAFVQSGTGLYIKLMFPYLDALKALGKYSTIERAVLTMRPLYESYLDKTPLPYSMYMYASREIGVENQLLVDPLTNQPQTGNFLNDDESIDGAKYTYDITNFLKSQLGAPDNQKGFLLLKMNPRDMQGNVQRAIFCNSLFEKDYNRIELKIYYTIYDDQN